MLLLVDKDTDLEIERLTVRQTANAQTPDSAVAFAATCSENVRPTGKVMHNYSPHSIKTKFKQQMPSKSLQQQLSTNIRFGLTTYWVVEALHLSVETHFGQILSNHSTLQLPHSLLDVPTVKCPPLELSDPNGPVSVDSWT